MLDVDGVLLSDKRPWTETLNVDLGIDPQQFQAEFFKKHWHKIIVGQAETKPLLSDALQRMGASIKADDFLKYWFEKDADIVADVLERVDVLRQDGWLVYLATNQEHLRAAYLMDDLGLSDHVDGILYSAALRARKPHEAFYKGASQAVFADRFVMIDDKPENVEAAIKFGWAGCHWTARQSLDRAIKLALS